MSEVYIEKIDEVHIRVNADPHVKVELSEHFEFFADGYQFMPKYKSGVWDGKIRLFNSYTGLIYAGLLRRVLKFCQHRDYQVTLAYELLETDNKYPDDVGYSIAKQFDAIYEPHYYQNDAVLNALQNKRSLLLSPTASGKSFIIYLIARYHWETHGRRSLILAPNIGLVKQLASDFVEYNKDKELDIHQITSGASKEEDSAYTISTWQSVYKLPEEWFEQFQVIFGDEAHLFKAKSLTQIMEKTPHIEHRHGLTGTLDDSLTNKLVLEGLFGPVFRVTKTRDLIKEGKLSDFQIRALTLNYDEVSRKAVKGSKYQEEIDWIVSREARNKYIYNLASKIPGNTLVLFQYVEKHGKPLYEIFRKSNSKKIHFVHGEVDGDAREEVRRMCEESSDNIVLASYGTFSTGTNIKNLDNIIFASPSKSKIRNLQSIGRVLRKSKGKKMATLYDLVDDLQWRNDKNYAIKHFLERMKIYNEEEFKVKLFNVPIKG